MSILPEKKQRIHIVKIYLHDVLHGCKAGKDKNTSLSVCLVARAT